jgi:hypothetical protein
VEVIKDRIQTRIKQWKTHINLIKAAANAAK